MKYILSTVTAVALFVGASSLALAQKGGATPSGSMKFGVVDTRKILEQMPEVKEAEEKLREVGTKFKDTLDTIQKDYIDALQAYEKQKAMMPAEAKAKAEENLQSIQQRYLKYRDEKINSQVPTSEISKMQEELLDPLRKKVKNAIKEVAKDEKLSGVLESPAFIYVDESLDITFRVLDRLKRNK